MKPYLADVNVLLALLVQSHQFHAAAVAWYDGLGIDQLGLCRITQLGAVRLLANPSVMGSAVLTVPVAWDMVSALHEDERVKWLAEPSGLDQTARSWLTYPAPAGKMVTDAYLAAFAERTGRRLATTDKALTAYPRLDWFLIGS